MRMEYYLLGWNDKGREVYIMSPYFHKDNWWMWWILRDQDGKRFMMTESIDWMPWDLTFKPKISKFVKDFDKKDLYRIQQINADIHFLNQLYFFIKYEWSNQSEYCIKHTSKLTEYLSETPIHFTIKKNIELFFKQFGYKWRMQ